MFYHGHQHAGVVLTLVKTEIKYELQNDVVVISAAMRGRGVVFIGASQAFSGN